ncbi:MAG: sensor histidine kinase, partial [bacterium]
LGSLYLAVITGQKSIADTQDLALENAVEKTQKFISEKMEIFNLVVSGTALKLSDIDAPTLDYLLNNLYQLTTPLEIVFADSDGQILGFKSTVNNQVDTSIYNRPDFITAMSGKNYYGQIETINGKLAMRLASQIQNSDHANIGVISALIDLTALEKKIKAIKLGNTGLIFLLDKDNNKTLAAPENIANNQTEITKIISSLNKDGWQSLVGLLYQTKPIISIKGDGISWLAVSEWPADDAQSVIYDILVQSAIIILISLILTVVLSLIMVRQIVKPIAILENGAKQIAKGKLDLQINLKTGDEFETLGDNFNMMTKALAENQKLKDEFVFIAAHELRTPVTAIKGYLSMILEKSFGNVPEKINKPLKIVEAANQRLVQLVEDLLEVARSDAGRMQIELSPLSIGEQIQTVIKELESLAKQKNIAINYKSELSNKKVLADAYKIKEVLINLIGNAIKYTLTDGGIEISHEIKDNLLITHIKDHGMGISKENLAKLFKKFYRVESDQTAKIEGTGLGLFICKQIVERMEGGITAESEAGQGSTFSFSLKLA